jgi:hypothetical protein
VFRGRRSSNFSICKTAAKSRSSQCDLHKVSYISVVQQRKSAEPRTIQSVKFVKPPIIAFPCNDPKLCVRSWRIFRLEICRVVGLWYPSYPHDVLRLVVHPVCQSCYNGSSFPRPRNPSRLRSYKWVELKGTKFLLAVTSEKLDECKSYHGPGFQAAHLSTGTVCQSFGTCFADLVHVGYYKADRACCFAHHHIIMRSHDSLHLRSGITQWRLKVSMPSNTQDVIALCPSVPT